MNGGYVQNKNNDIRYISGSGLLDIQVYDTYHYFKTCNSLSLRKLVGVMNDYIYSTKDDDDKNLYFVTSKNEFIRTYALNSNTSSMTSNNFEWAGISFISGQESVTISSNAVAKKWTRIINNNTKVAYLVNFHERTANEDIGWHLGFLICDISQRKSNFRYEDYWKKSFLIDKTISSVGIGSDVWVSSDLKWMFWCKPSNSATTTNRGYSKDIQSLSSNSSLFNESGYTNAGSLNDSSTQNFREVCKKYFVYDILFNNNSDKMLVFCNDTKPGLDLPNSSVAYLNANHPTHLLGFILRNKKWEQISTSIFDPNGVWNTYLSSNNGDTAFKPYPSVDHDYENKLALSFVFPSGSASTSFYYTSITFGD